MKSLRNQLWEMLPQIHENIQDDLLSKRPDIQESLNPTFDMLHDPFLLKDMYEVVKRIGQAIENKEKILIYGDYDVDGMTSTALLQKTLKKLGADVENFLPHRTRDGYGLHKKFFETFQEQGVKLLITVDTGITAVDEVKALKKLDIDAIITDHHTPLENIPDCLILNPKQPHCNYPFKGLAGVGVVYKLLQALSSLHPEIDEAYLKWSLAETALGTVVDCAQLVGENRVMVSLGLLALQKSKEPWIRTLCMNLRKDQLTLNVYSLGFQIGPRLNASGRMDDPKYALKFLQSTSITEADEYLKRLETNNDDRKLSVDESLKKVISTIDNTKKGIVLYNPKWHIGVVGLIAGRLAEQFHKPVIAMTLSEGRIVGSVRNPVTEVHITEVLSELSEHLDHYGGHAQAAGLSTSEVKIERFIKAAYKIFDRFPDRYFIKKILVDREVPIQDFQIQDFRNMQQLQPFGLGNKTPIFLLKKCVLTYLKTMGKDKSHLSCTIQQERAFVRGVAFQVPYWIDTLEQWEEVDVIGKFSENVWNGKTTMNFQIIDIREHL